MKLTRLLTLSSVLVTTFSLWQVPTVLQGQGAVAVAGEPENMVTLGGIGPYVGDGQLATAAGLNLVEGVAVDAAGSLWIADTNNNRIRKVNAATGIITTVAGSGLVGFSGDGGPATQARLNTPSDIALDASGNFYFTDSGNQRVRKVDSATGIITTVAGGGIAGYFGDNGPAVAAHLNGPRGIALAVEPSGLCIYVAEIRNHVIRKVDGAGIVTTVAGTGVGAISPDGGLATQTPLNTPFGLALDAVGNLYVGEGGVGGEGFSHRVRRVDAVSRVISTVAGTMGVGGFSGDGGLATAARINSPRDIAFDGLGNLYFADNGNNRIRVVNVTAGPSATIATFAGSGVIGGGGDGGLATAAQFGNPIFIAIDSWGNLYIGDRGNSRARRVDAATRIVTTVAGGHIPPPGDGAAATDASILNPAGLAFDSWGNAYLAENFTHRIRRVDGTTKAITTIAGTGTPGFSPDGTPSIGAPLNGPQGIALDAALNLYIAETGSFRVRKIDGSGTITTVAGVGIPGFSGDGGPATQARLNSFRNVALDAAGNLWIADSLNHRVRFVNLSAAPVNVAGQLVAPGVIITVVGAGISGSSGDGGPASIARINAPIGLAFDSAGNLYLSESNRVRLVNLSNATITIHNQVVHAFHIITIAGGATPGSAGDGGPASAAQFFGPQGLAFDAAGNLYIADALNHSIRRVDTTGVITTVAGTGAPGFSGDGGPATNSSIVNPRYVALDAWGNLHFTEFGGNRIRRLNVAAKELTVLRNRGNVVGQVALHDGRAVADLSKITLTVIDSSGRSISSSFPGDPVALGNPRERTFLFGSQPALLEGLSFRLEGRFANDGRRFSGDCILRNLTRCLNSVPQSE